MAGRIVGLVGEGGAQPIRTTEAFQAGDVGGGVVMSERAEGVRDGGGPVKTIPGVCLGAQDGTGITAEIFSAHTALPVIDEFQRVIGEGAVDCFHRATAVCIQWPVGVDRAHNAWHLFFDSMTRSPEPEAAGRLAAAPHYASGHKPTHSRWTRPAGIVPSSASGRLGEAFDSMS